MLTRLGSALSLCGLLLAGGPASAIDEDPCSDVVCDEDGCTACWTTGADTIECDEFLALEIQILCQPSDPPPQGLHLTAPQEPRGPVQLNLGRGQLLPQTPQPPIPQPRSDPGSSQ